MTESPAARVAEQAQALARFFHETYERLAPSFGYKTREASAVPWADVPEQNRSLMVAVAARDAAEARVATLQQERDGRYAQLQGVQRWFNEQSAELVAVREDVTRLREALAHAADYCARPAGVCFDPALVVSSQPGAPEEAQSAKNADVRADAKAEA